MEVAVVTYMWHRVHQQWSSMVDLAVVEYLEVVEDTIVMVGME